MITINKKHIMRFASYNYGVGDDVAIQISEARIVSIEGDMYTLDVSDLERGEFIKKAADSIRDAGAFSMGALYDAGARFK